LFSRAREEYNGLPRPVVSVEQSMSELLTFLRRLWYEGRVLLHDRRGDSSQSIAGALDALAEAYGAYRLEVAGPPVPFDCETAIAAARFVHLSAWYLVRREGTEEELRRDLAMPTAPTQAAHHLSADLTLRYLPQIYSRARAHAPDDALTQVVAGTLRTWPLSGVLSAVDEPPLSPLDFGGHWGLALLYAERLVEHEKAGWFPPDGLAREYAELVYQKRGKTLPANEGTVGASAGTAAS
jgi:hypothetical protein